MRLTRTVAPVAAAITLAQAKAQCRVDGADEDDALQLLIEAVTDHLDGPSGILGRAIVTQTWVLELEAWPDSLILPLEPVQSVAVSYLDAADQVVAVDAAAFVLDVTPSAKTVLRWTAGFSWPQVGSQPHPVRVTIVAGFGAAAAVPSGLKKAMLRLVEWWHLGQGAGGPGRPDAVPVQIDALLARWRVML